MESLSVPNGVAVLKVRGCADLRDLGPKALEALSKLVGGGSTLCLLLHGRLRLDRHRGLLAFRLSVIFRGFSTQITYTLKPRRNLLSHSALKLRVSPTWDSSGMCLERLKGLEDVACKAE